MNLVYLLNETGKWDLLESYTERVPEEFNSDKTFW